MPAKHTPPPKTWPVIEKPARLWFRDRFRDARAAALRDAEAFDEIVVVLEKLGGILVGPELGLGKYKDAIAALAVGSTINSNVPEDDGSGLHLPFHALFSAVRIRRNQAFHTGAVARHLTQQSVMLALVLEESLMHGFQFVRDFMVSSPVCAELWQPLSFIRQNMLLNSFSYLPVKVTENGSDCWRVVSDRVLAAYVREVPDKQRERFAQTLLNAVERNSFELEEAKVVDGGESLSKVIQLLNHLPILVTSGSPTNLTGILTAHDLL